MNQPAPMKQAPGSSITIFEAFDFIQAPNPNGAPVL